MKKIWIFLPLFLLLSACISPPKGMEKDNFSLSDLRTITTEDYTCQCKQARLGGKILSATALKDKTRIEVLSLPVSYFSAKPVLGSLSDGRFIAYLNGFIDPESLKDQYITVLGTLKGKEQGKIDEVNYQYPVIDTVTYKRWRLVQEYYYDPDDWADYWEYRRFGFGGYLWRPEPRLRYNLY